MKTSNDDDVRLNKHLALLLGTSRRQADQLIKKGSVLINGDVALIGGRIKPSSDILVVNGKVIASSRDSRELIYLLFHKPAGYVCSKRRQGDTPTIYEALPPEYQQLKSVGRLDKDSSGLLILTNDGDFAHQMTHPKFYKVKVYEVGLNKKLEPLHHQMINDYGVRLEDGPSKLTLDRIKKDDDKNWRVTMHEGRNRQIRRTFESLGYSINRLHRTNFGNFSLDDIAEGQIKKVTID